MNKTIFFILFLLMIPIAVAWTPPSDINLRLTYRIFNGTNISAVSFFQNGNAVLDNSSPITNINFSSFANSSFYWDDLNTTTDITDVGNLTNLIIDGNTTSTWYFGFINWSDVQNKFITATDNVYLYMSGTTITLNETKLNETVDVIVVSANTSMKAYVDGTFITLVNESNLNVNHSNSSDFWDDLNTSLDITNLGNVTSQFFNVTNNITSFGEIHTPRFRFMNGNNLSYMKISDTAWIDVNASLVFGNNEPNLDQGAITNLFYAQENKTMIWTQFGMNHSYGGWGNSLGLIPNYMGINNFSNGTHVNMTALANYIIICDTFGVDCNFNADTAGRARGLIPGGPLLWTMGDLEVWGQANIIEGASIRTNLDVFLNNSDMDIVGGHVHLREEVIVEIGFGIGDEVQTLHETFEDGELDPFVQETSGGGANEWSVGSIAVCDNDFCVEASGAGGNPLRTMAANFSTVNMSSCNLTFLLSTVGLTGSDNFSVTVNNNSGSGNVLLFNITDGADVTETTITVLGIISEINNNSANSLRFNLQAGNNRDAIVVVVFFNCNDTASTLANVSRFNSEICLGEGLLVSAGGRCIHDIFWNDTSKTLNLPGNTSFQDVTEITLNVTTSITLGAETITNWANVSIFDTNVLLVNGSRSLTRDWDAGTFNISALWLKGIFNWVVNSSDNYLAFNGTQLDFNETKLNATFQKAITPNQCTGSDFVVGIATNGSLNCSTPAGSGTITGVFTNTSDGWLEGNADSGNAIMLFNETQLNGRVWNISAGVSAFVNRSLWTSIDDYPADCSSPNVTRGIGDTLTCILPDSSGQCTGDVCGGGHTHPASEVTAGTFGTGNYVMDTNLTVETIKFEGNSTDIYITANATTGEFHGPTASIFVW